jgi:hypothetical protein
VHASIHPRDHGEQDVARLDTTGSRALDDLASSHVMMSRDVKPRPGSQAITSWKLKGAVMHASM